MRNTHSPAAASAVAAGSPFTVVAWMESFDQTVDPAGGEIFGRRDVALDGHAVEAHGGVVAGRGEHRLLGVLQAEILRHA